MKAKKKKRPRLKTPLSSELLGLPGRVRTLRSLCQIGSVELDRLAGIGQGRVSRIESGERLDGVRADVILKIANATGANPSWLLTGQGEMWAAGPNPLRAVK